MQTFPTLFLSHGAPTIAVQRTAASAFLRGLSSRLAKPEAILVVSAHWEAPVSVVGTGLDTIHDFYGFPEALYRLHYPAPAAPALAARVQSLLKAAGLATRLDVQRGRDHGAWVPLLLAWPEANIPVAQLSLVRGASGAQHFAVGQALRALRAEGVLIIGSGSATHNLRALPTERTEPWAKAFIQWLDGVLAGNDDDDLMRWQRDAPFALQNHPSTEHFDPILVARGAAAGERVTVLHSSWEFGSLNMNAYQFGV